MLGSCTGTVNKVVVFTCSANALRKSTLPLFTLLGFPKQIMIAMSSSDG